MFGARRLHGERVLQSTRNTRTSMLGASARLLKCTRARSLCFPPKTHPAALSPHPIFSTLLSPTHVRQHPGPQKSSKFPGRIFQRLRFPVRGRSSNTARRPIFSFTGNPATSVSSPAPDAIWEKMVGGDLSQAEILFKRHREKLFRFTCGQLGARRRSAQSDADDIVQECFTRLLQLAQRLCLLHQHINTPALLTQLLAECTSPGSSHTPAKLSDLARWIKRILGDQFPKLPHCHPWNNSSAANWMDS
jgi:hypothetical protein